MQSTPRAIVCRCLAQEMDMTILQKSEMSQFRNFLYSNYAVHNQKKWISRWSNAWKELSIPSGARRSSNFSLWECLACCWAPPGLLDFERFLPSFSLRILPNSQRLTTVECRSRIPCFNCSPEWYYMKENTSFYFYIYFIFIFYFYFYTERTYNSEQEKKWT